MWHIQKQNFHQQLIFRNAEFGFRNSEFGIENPYRSKTNEPFGPSYKREGIRFILPVTIRRRVSLLQTRDGINFGLVRMYVTWIIFT